MIQICDLKHPGGLEEITQVEMSEIKGAGALDVIRSFFEGIDASAGDDVDLADTLSERFLGGFPTPTSTIVDPASFTDASSFSLGTPGTF